MCPEKCERGCEQCEFAREQRERERAPCTKCTLRQRLIIQQHGTSLASHRGGEPTAGVQCNDTVNVRHAVYFREQPECVCFALVTHA